MTFRHRRRVHIFPGQTMRVIDPLPILFIQRVFAESITNLAEAATDRAGYVTCELINLEEQTDCRFLL